MTAGIFFRWPCEAGEVVFLLLTVAAVATGLSCIQSDEWRLCDPGGQDVEDVCR